MDQNFKYIPSYKVFEVNIEDISPHPPYGELEQRAFIYVQYMYQIFKRFTDEWVSRNNLRLGDKAREFKIPKNLQTIIISNELIKKSIFYKLKFPDKEPKSIEDIVEYVKEYRKKVNNYQKQIYSNMTPEEKEKWLIRQSELEKQRHSNMTPEEKEKYNKKQLEYVKRWYDKLTPGEKEEYNKKQNKHQKQKLASMTPEEKKDFFKKQREYKKQSFDKLTPEEKEKYVKKENELRRLRFANMTPEEKEKYLNKKNERARRWYANMTPEEKEKLLKKNIEYQKRWKENKEIRSLFNDKIQDYLDTMNNESIDV